MARNVSKPRGKKNEEKWTGWFDEISRCLRWAQDRSVPLAFFGLTISGLLSLELVAEFRLSIGMSAGLLSALPLLFALVAVIVLVLALALVSPAGALFVRFAAHGDRRLIDLQSERFRPALRWFVWSLANALIWIALVFTAYLNEHEINFSDVCAGLLASTLLGVLILGPWRVELGQTHDWAPAPAMKVGLTLGVLKSEWGAIIDLSVWLFLQTAALLCALQISLPLIPEPFRRGSGVEDWLVIGATLFYSVVIPIIAQVAVVRWIKSGSVPGILERVVMVACGMVSLVLLCPPLAGRLAAYPFMESATGGQQCVIYAFQAKQVDRVDVAAIDPGAQARTKMMHVAVLLDGIYFLKTSRDDSAMYRIPAEIVTSALRCPVSDALGDPRASRQMDVSKKR